MNVLTSITVLGFLIFFHEMGHFLAAILQGIYVDGFSIGFGPSIIQKRYKNITYSLRAFPLGGFVSFPDEELNNIDPKDPNLLKNSIQNTELEHLEFLRSHHFVGHSQEWQP